MVTDDDRRNLYEALEGTLGRVPAATLMALLPPVGWSELATRSDVAMLRTDLEAQGVALRGEMAELRAELKGEMAELRSEVRSMLPKLVAANIASMVGVAGLVLGAVSVG